MPIFFCKISVRLYEKAGWPDCRISIGLFIILGCLFVYFLPLDFRGVSRDQIFVETLHYFVIF